MALPVPMPPNGSAISFTIPKPSASSTNTSSDQQHDAADRGRRCPALGGGVNSPIIRSMNSWRPEGASWPSFSIAVLQLVRPALGERQRGLHHLAQRGALLRVAAGERLVEVLARRP